ncbi:hypothetical protein [Streptomyces jumonjinensis]|uniref:hypothetical protein n=1 Tax=Streptomyces jumonjinensis TaxID=1945 RepID=UPI00379E40F8
MAKPMTTFTKIFIAVVGMLLLAIPWTGAAGEWQDKGCTSSQGYGYFLIHGGWPDENEGCEDEPDGPVFTDEYGEW